MRNKKFWLYLGLVVVLTYTLMYLYPLYKPGPDLKDDRIIFLFRVVILTFLKDLYDIKFLSRKMLLLFFLFSVLVYILDIPTNHIGWTNFQFFTKLLILNTSFGALWFIHIPVFLCTYLVMFYAFAPKIKQPRRPSNPF